MLEIDDLLLAIVLLLEFIMIVYQLMAIFIIKMLQTILFKSDYRSDVTLHDPNRILLNLLFVRVMVSTRILVKT